MTLEIAEATAASLDGSSLALLRIPFIFSQDQLIKSDEFIKLSAERGYPLKLLELQALYQYKLLIPLYYVDDIAVDENRVSIRHNSYSSTTQMVFTQAEAGHIRDCSESDFSTEFPFEIPLGRDGTEWWNGYVYSSWQLGRVPRALNSLRQLERATSDGVSQPFHNQFRADYLALSALSTLYLPGIIGQRSSLGEVQDSIMRQFINETKTKDCLIVSGFEPERLKSAAAELLNQARMNDPLMDWWPLIRHSNLESWKKLKGVALHCLWLRIAAEVFLRAHENLAEAGLLEPLPDLNGARFRDSLHDRITPHWENERPLESELAVFGLSPHPRVLLLVEGDTEEIHFNALLKEIGLNRPNRVRVQNAEGSKVDAKLLSRYLIAPRPSHTYSQYQWMLPPTVLVIAMDPENKWKTPEDKEDEMKGIRNAVKREVARQGAKITERELNHLVTVFVWPGGTYEVANFTDSELLEGMVKLTLLKKPEFLETPEWREKLLVAIQEARRLRCQFKEKVGILKVPDDKVELAKILLPVLIAKYHKESNEPQYVTPVFQVIEKVQELFALFASGVFTYETKKE